MTAVAGPDNVAVARRAEKPFGRFEIVVQLIVELLEEFVADREERRRRIDDHHQRQRNGIPGSQPDANRGSGPPRHGSPSRNTNPTPRTV